jgi:hypothetical protein
MADVLPLLDPSNYARALDRIKELWRRGLVQVSQHAQDRMRERGLDMNDVQNVIRTGVIIEHSCPKVLWCYKIVGQAVDADPASCVVAIDGRLIVVTVMNE